MIRLGLFLAGALASAPAWAQWDLMRLTDDAAKAVTMADGYQVDVSCVRGREAMTLSIYPLAFDRSDSDGMAGVAVLITLPDGRTEQASVPLEPMRDGFFGPLPVRAGWLAAFKDGREISVRRSDDGRELFRAPMAGTGAARLLFAERCGI